MASWHDRDCRRPDVSLMDNIPTCLSCGALFLQTDETQGELSKQTAVAGKGSRRLNLDWPSSVTFHGPDDVTDPDLRTALLALDRYIEHDDTDTALMEGDALAATKMTHSATPGDSEEVKEDPAANAAADGYEVQASAKNSDIDLKSGDAQLDSTSRNTVYQSLMGSDEIRLLHLDPQENASQPLHGHLRPSRLSMRPDYIALSYTWADANGDRTLRDKIFLGTAWAPFAITSNCAAALRRLRLRGGTCVVWVDAICIDQNNIAERSHQVSMMRDIYSRAESVTIFLGGDTDINVDDTPARRLLQRLSRERFHAGKAVTSNWGGHFDYHGVRDLFQRPYWSRIWVIQEILLARQAEIVLGDAGVSWPEFMTNFLSRASRTVNDPAPPWIYLSGGSLFGDADSFLSLLQKTSTSRASDDRDMVFALFGLVQGASLESLVADYSKTRTEIYVGLTAYFLIRHGHVDLLKIAACAASYTARNEFLQTSDGIEGDLDLPSWVSFATFRTSSEISHEMKRFQNYEVSSLRLTPYSLFPTIGRRSLRTQPIRTVPVRPTDCHPIQAPLPSLTAYKVFGNHGALLIRAFPVVHMPQMRSTNGAFTVGSTNISTTGSTCGLTAIGTVNDWGIFVRSGVPSIGSSDWIVETPGCDNLLHLRASGRVPNTYKIASLSSVALVTISRRPRHDIEIEPREVMETIDPTQNPRPEIHYWPIQHEQLPSAQIPAVDYRLWMPLISFGLQHLLFLRRWELNTLTDALLAPCQSEQRDSLADLSNVLEKYGRWLELKYPPSIDDGGNHDFDAAVRTVSQYLERWEDLELWSRIYKIVVDVPWGEKLQELSDIKMDAWNFLVTRNDRQTGGGEQFCDWQQRLQELFEDLAGRLSDMPLRHSTGEPCLRSFMSMDTYFSLRNSIGNLPESWTTDDIRAFDPEVFTNWTGVESFWDFLNRSQADCRALRAKFVQLQALKRLCRREQRDFLIC